MSETTAEVVATPSDNRPEPPAYPDQWAVRHQAWTTYNSKYMTDVWRSRLDGPYDTFDDAEKAAQGFMWKASRNVRIVRIPGEQAAREGEGGKER